MGNKNLFVLFITIAMMLFNLMSTPELGQFGSEQPTSYTNDTLPSKLILGSGGSLLKRDPYKFSDIATHLVLIDFLLNNSSREIKPLIVNDSSPDFLYSFDRKQDFFLNIHGKPIFI